MIRYWVAAIAVLIALARFRNRRRHPIRGVAVVTGASSGIGEALALQLARRHITLVLVARTVSKLEAVAAACREAGATEVFVFAADVTDAAQRIALVTFVENKVLRSTSKLTLLALNAGRGAITPFDGTPETMRICEEMMAINYFANVHLMQLCMPLLAQAPANAKGSAILVISSLAGVLPTPLRTAYTASKHALQGFCNALRCELSSKAVRICVCCPGFVQTEFHHKVMSADGRAPKRHAQSFMTADECASQCLSAVERGATELVMTWTGWAGHKLRPLIPGIVDAVATKKAMATLSGH